MLLGMDQAKMRRKRRDLFVQLTFEDWLIIGYKAGWCGPPVCSEHDGIPTSDIEESQIIDGEEPCINIVRLYPDEITRLSVEENHSPSVWRAHNMGWR